MFNTKLFGYDKEQVNEEIRELNQKIRAQQRDLNYFRDRSKRLQQKVDSLESDEEVYEK